MTLGYATPFSPPPSGKTASPFGIVSLVFGILAILISWIPFCGMAAIPVAGLGLIFALVGFIIAVSGGRNGMGFPIAGTILCIGAVGIQIAVTGGLVMMSNRVPRTLASPVQTGAPTTLSADNGFTLVNDPEADDLKTLLATEAAKADALGRKPFVEFYASWCGPCKALAKALDDSDPQMVDAFAGTYIIRLDSDKWSNQLAGTGMTADTIPVFYELTSAGKATSRHIDGGAWGDNTPDNMAPPLKKFFQGD